MIKVWNEEVFRVLHGFLEQYPGLEPWVSFGTKPIWEAPVGALDSIAISAVFFVLFLYYDGAPGILNVTRYTWRKVTVIGLTGVIAWSMAVILKKVFLVPRPYVALSDITPLFELGTLDSFPSGHAAFFAALSVAVYYYHRKLGALFVLATVGIGLARIIAGVHYPLDILAGFVLGGGGAIIMALILRLWVKKHFR